MAEIKDQEYINFLLNLKEDDITTTLIMKTFGEFDGKKNHETTDTFTVPANSFGNDKVTNEKPFVTTLGKWFFNKLFIEQELVEKFGYINEAQINKKFLNKLNSEISYAILEDELPLDTIKHFQLKLQVMMSTVSILAYNIDDEMLTVSTKIDKRKMELVNQYKKEILAGDSEVADKITKELLAYAKEVLKDNNSLDIYDSGARASFDNNFKNLYVMRGAVANDNNTDKEYDIILSNYINGIKKEDFVATANSLAEGPYGRANKTQLGGYIEKLYVLAYQHLKTDPEGSDCGTKRYVTVNLTEDNISSWMYSYIIDGGKLVELNSTNKNKYIGKKVKFRFSSLCESKTGICNKCIGNLFYKLNIKNVGLLTAKPAAEMKQKSMEAFHDLNVKLTEIDLAKAFGIDE